MKLWQAMTFFAVALGTASGASFDLNSGLFFANTGGVGTGRAIGFQALSDVAITSVAIEGNLVQQLFEVVLYSSTDGSTPGAILSTTQATVGGMGFGFNTINVNLSLTQDQYYILNWRPAISSSFWASLLAYYSDGALPVTVGPFRLLDGIENFDATNRANSVHPNLRVTTGPVNVIPEPSSIALVVIGLGAAAWRRLRA